MKKESDTEELRIEQAKRERSERESEEQARSEESTETHRRRADKAAYLREKLEKRAESERDE